MSSTSEDRLLGEYRLKELLSENDLTRTWLAEQVSVSRRVLVDELREDQAGRQDVFLANVRAKAAVEYPLIGSVYEAVAEPGRCFYAHELLLGTTFAERLKARLPYHPGQLAHFLRRVAEAQIHHEMLGQATDPLGLEQIHVDEHGVIRLENLAIGGARTPEDSRRDIGHLGQSLLGLVEEGQPGATRMLTLLAWMRGEGIEAPLTWQQVKELGNQIEQQLADPPPPATATKSAVRPQKKSPAAWVAGVCALAIVAGLIFSLTRKPQAPPAPKAANLPAAILIPGGKHPTPDGTEEELRAYRISSHEVTIGEYAAFLETLETLAKDNRQKTFDHEDQPPEKTSHEPDDWAALYAAAKSHGTWKEYPVSLDSPVVGVDWWDCTAFAEWKHARLATQEEWFAALRKDVPVPSALVASGFTPVAVDSADRTPQGLIGMAGSVCEWTRRPAANPANPLGERKWVIIGGSYQKPGSNALAREWTNDRSLRRADLGFRLVFDAD